MAKSGSRSKTGSRGKRASSAKRRSVKAASASRTTTTRTGGRKKATGAKAAPRGKGARRRREVELRPIRKQLHAAVKKLQGFHKSSKVEDAIKRLDVCLAEINEICGPDMAIPDPSEP